MTLNKSTIRDLQSELKRLERRSTAIKDLLATEGVSINGGPPKGRPGRPISKNGETFTSKVVKVLGRLNGPSSIAQIVDELEANGVQPAGKTPLTTLVSGELSRLARDGDRGVVSPSRGVYYVVEQLREKPK